MANAPHTCLCKKLTSLRKQGFFKKTLCISKSRGLSSFPPILLCNMGLIPLLWQKEFFFCQLLNHLIMSKEEQNFKEFDFENAELIGEWRLNEIYESKEKMRCQQNSNGKWYLVVEPRYSGLEKAMTAYYGGQETRKPSFSKDSLVVYQSADTEDVGTNNEFACIYHRAYEGGDD